MLSRNRAQFVEESVRSILAQTYTNWELLFVDDNSKDDTIKLLIELKASLDKPVANKIRVSQTVADCGSTVNTNEALKEAHGKWIAFLNTGDLWKPEKLERQIQFMASNDYALSYTKYDIIDRHSKSRNAVVGGPEVIDERLMSKCFWTEMLAVMYDAEKIGKVQMPAFKNSNSYGMLMKLSEKATCHLLDENLGTNRTKRGLFNGVPLNKKLAWRYDVYRKVGDMGCFRAALKTIENVWYTIVKRVKYVEKSKE